MGQAIANVHIGIWIHLKNLGFQMQSYAPKNQTKQSPYFEKLKKSTY